MEKTKYKSFEEARRFVRNLKLKSEIEWDKYNYKILRRGGARPKDIPVNPEQVYKELGWIDYADWLGIEYLEFEIARHFVKKVKFKNLDEWKRRYYLVFPDELKIPFYPDLVYEQKGWQGWDHWFGKEYYDYEIARSIVKNLNFQSREDFGEKNIIPKSLMII